MNRMFSCVAAIAVLSLCGCETDSATAKVRISPESAAIRKGQSIEFTASGGYEYQWSIQDSSWGVLSTREGDRTVYTSLFSPEGTSAVQVITVTSTISGSAGGTTNMAAYQMTAQADIIHE